MTSERIEEFVPETEWPSTATMLQGFGEPGLPASGDLVGRTLDVLYDSAPRTTYEFLTSDEIAVDEAEQERRIVQYRAVEARPGIFYLDLLDGAMTATVNDSLILDLSDGRVTRARSRFVDLDGKVRTTTDFFSGRVAGTGPIEPRLRTSELVGLRIFYRYSATEAYEHIYLDAGTFVWHCVRGGEAGLADVDRAEAWELGDGLYVLYWQESVMAVESFLIVDLQKERSIGRMFCWDAPTLGAVHIPFDSRFTILNKTTYPADPK